MLQILSQLWHQSELKTRLLLAEILLGIGVPVTVIIAYKLDLHMLDVFIAGVSGLIIGFILRYLSKRYHINMESGIMLAFGHGTLISGIILTASLLITGEISQGLKRAVFAAYVIFFWAVIIYLGHKADVKRKALTAWEEVDRKDIKNRADNEK